jgi:hypothetical protein
MRSASVSVSPVRCLYYPMAASLRAVNVRALNALRMTECAMVFVKVASCLTFPMGAVHLAVIAVPIPSVLPMTRCVADSV